MYRPTWFTKSLQDESPKGSLIHAFSERDSTLCGKITNGMWCIGEREEITCKECKKRMGHKFPIIVSAASIIDIDGKQILWRCHRHSDPFTTIAQFLPVGYAKCVAQGFVDREGKFLTRKEAYIVAKENEQLLPRKDNGYQGEELFSEDLW